MRATERNSSIMVEFCCFSQPHAPSLETKQRAQLGNYLKIETAIQRPVCLYFSRQGFCAALSSQTTPFLTVYFLVRSGAD